METHAEIRTELARALHAERVARSLRAAQLRPDCEKPLHTAASPARRRPRVAPAGGSAALVPRALQLPYLPR